MNMSSTKEQIEAAEAWVTEQYNADKIGDSSAAILRQALNGASNLIESLQDQLTALQVEYNKLNDFEQSQCAKLLVERGSLIDLAGNWKEAADAYHAERNELQKELAESHRREQAAIKDLNKIGSCVMCKHNKWPCEREDNGHATCFEWRGPQEGANQ